MDCTGCVKKRSRKFKVLSKEVYFQMHDTNVQLVANKLVCKSQITWEMYNSLTTSVQGFLKVFEPRPRLGQRLCIKTSNSERQKGVKQTIG